MADDHQKNLQRFMGKQKQIKSNISSSSSSLAPATPPPPPLPTPLPPPPPPPHIASDSLVHGRDRQLVLVQNGVDGANNNNIHVGTENNVAGRNNNVKANVFPPGYRFCPLDGELIFHYLMNKINNKALPHDQIREVNLYDYNPRQLTDACDPVGESEWYFFTPRDRKYRNGNRPNRAAGDGYWKATGADKPVVYEGEKVGFRKALVFYHGKPPMGSKTNWIMHEYRANGPERTRLDAHDMRLDDYVLCRVYNKEEKDSKSQARSVKEESAQPPKVRVRSQDDRQEMMNNNEALFSGMGSAYNGVEDSNDNYHDHYHRLMMKRKYGEMHPTGFSHTFAPQAPPAPAPSIDFQAPPPPFIDFSNSYNGGFQYGSRPGGNVPMSLYYEEDQLLNFRRGLIQESMWDNRNHNYNNLQNFPRSLQFDISTSGNLMVESADWNHLDIDFGSINPDDVDYTNNYYHPADVHPPNAVSSYETLNDIVIDNPAEDPHGSTFPSSPASRAK